MNCPHCGMPEIQDTGDVKIWHKWECGNVILWPTDGSSKSRGAHTPACRQIATLDKRVCELQQGLPQADRVAELEKVLKQIGHHKCVTESKALIYYHSLKDLALKALTEENK